MSSAADIEWMAQALKLAAQGLNTTRPNPRVGCVIVKDGQCVGEGWHQRAGEPHAEVHALKQAGHLAQGATAYVTLEPCSHYGRTPPCADALLKAGISRVVTAMQDPNPLVAGQGLERLQAAGIITESGVLEAEARALNCGFIKRMSLGLPWIRLKMGLSLDGGTALANGQSQWITSPEARLDVQHWRARSCAILTGSGTVLADDPALNVRLETFAGPQPLRVVLDSQLRMPSSSRMLRLAGQTRIYCCETAPAEARASLQQAGAELVPITAAANGLDLKAVLADLANSGLNEVLVEAGATLAGALLQQGLVDELLLYQAPKLLGDQARGAFALGQLQHLSEALQLKILDQRAVGPDTRWQLQILRESEPAA